MKSYLLKDLDAATLPQIAVVRYEPTQPGVWEELARKELGERDRLALGLLADKLLNYKTVRANEATLWSRAIYPLLVLAEREDVRAFSLVSLAATFDDVEIHGEVDGVLASSVDDQIDLPFFVVVEAKRGISGTDPVAQLVGAMLCTARLNEQGGHPAQEILRLLHRGRPLDLPPRQARLERPEAGHDPALVARVHGEDGGPHHPRHPRVRRGQGPEREVGTPRYRASPCVEGFALGLKRGTRRSSTS